MFCLPDAEIARQVREVLAEALPGDSGSIDVSVKGGIVTLTGQIGTQVRRNGLDRGIVMTWDLDGVVDIINHVTTAQEPTLRRWLRDRSPQRLSRAHESARRWL